LSKIIRIIIIVIIIIRIIRWAGGVLCKKSNTQGSFKAEGTTEMSKHLKVETDKRMILMTTMTIAAFALAPRGPQGQSTTQRPSFAAPSLGVGKKTGQAETGQRREEG
jgi:hypothetical protein